MKKPVKMANGWLRVDGTLTRTGVFDYVNPDGTHRRELRLPEEVFKADSLESFSMVPVTDEHPPEFLTAANTAKFAKGTLGETVRRDGELMRGPLLITDAELIEKLESGEAQELSCGYVCEVEDAPGVWQGQKYDGIQRDIRANHVAVVPRGRAGPSARVHMDAAQGEVIPISTSGKAPTTPEPNLVKMKIAGIEQEVADQAAQLIEKERTDTAAERKADSEKLAKLQADLDKATARADDAAEKQKKLDEEMKGLPAKLKAEAKARADLEHTAREALGEKAKLDGLTDRQVREKVVSQLTGAKCEGKSDAYVEARFDAAIEAFEEADEVRADDSSAGSDDAGDDERDDSEDDDEGDEHQDGDTTVENADSEAAYNRMVKNNRALHQQTLKRAQAS